MSYPQTDHLVGGLEHFLFFHILDIIIPIDELIFFGGVESQPPTSQSFGDFRERWGDLMALPSCFNGDRGMGDLLQIEDFPVPPLTTHWV